MGANLGVMAARQLLKNISTTSIEAHGDVNEVRKSDRTNSMHVCLRKITKLRCAKVTQLLVSLRHQKRLGQRLQMSTGTSKLCAKLCWDSIKRD